MFFFRQMKLFDLKKSKSTSPSNVPIIPVDTEKSLERKKVGGYERLSKLQSGTTIHGTINTTDNLYLNGSFVGDIKVKRKLVLGENSDIKGNIQAHTLIVLGKLEGDIYCEEDISFGMTSFFTGKISTKTIEVLNGAHFNAELTVRCLGIPDVFEDTNKSSAETNLQKVQGQNPPDSDNAFLFEIFHNQ